MKSVKIDRLELVKIIKANKDKRVKELAELKNKIDPYNKKILDQLVKSIEKTGKLDLSITAKYFNNKLENINTSRYDDLISMFEMAKDDKIPLTSGQFDNYVLDKNNFADYNLESFKRLLKGKDEY